MKRLYWIVGGIAASLLLVVGGCGIFVVGVVGVISNQGTGSNRATPAACLPVMATKGLAGLDAEQQRNAQTIVSVGQQLKVPQKGLEVAIATARQESGIRNLGHGSGSSLGLFQQITSWGSVAERTDPTEAARMFFTGSKSGHRGLLDIPGWQSMPVWQAAQAVQQSAFPTAYAQWEGLAAAVVAKFIGASNSGGSCNPTGPGVVTNCVPSGSPAEHGLQAKALNLLRCVVTNFHIHTLGGLGSRGNRSYHPTGEAVDVMIADWETPEGNARGWEVARWGQANAAQLGITQVIFDAKIWTSDRPGDSWRSYGHPSGARDPNSAHRNHVHFSIPEVAT